MKFGTKEIQNFELGNKQVLSVWYGDKKIWEEDGPKYIILNEFSLGTALLDNLYVVKYKTPQSLSITADDVSGRSTTTTIHWTMIYDIDGQYLTFTGNDTSEPFPQNPSTTETVQRTITYTKDGLTATTTITQGVWVDKSFTVTLNSGLTSYGFQSDSTSGLSLDQSVYAGPYQSDNYNIDSSYAVARIDVIGYTEFTVWINSYAESSFDYSIAGSIDASSYSTDNSTNAYSGNGYSTDYNSSSGKYSNTGGYQKNPSGAGSSTLSESYWRKITYILDGGSHHIYITYRKDVSSSSYNDRGYFVIER